MLNLGVGGYYYDAGSLDGISYVPDRVIVAYGSNDFDMVRTIEKFRENVDAYLKRIKETYGDKEVYVITPIWFLNSYPRPMGTLDDCRGAIEEIAKKYGFFVVDGKELFPEDESLLADHAHPTDRGNMVYAENLIKKMEKFKQ
jgi:lysophospholipase L1-like esterase